MHTVELLEEAIALAKGVGYQVRHDWLGGSGGGYCEIRGQKWIFLDLAVGHLDQLELVLETLRRESELAALPMPCQLQELLAVRKSA